MAKVWKKRMTKAAGVLAAVIIGMTGQQMRTEAFGGNWIQDAAGWYYQYEDGTIQGPGWGMIDGTWYHFGTYSYMDIGWIEEEDGRWFYLNSDGEMEHGWKFLDGGWYFLAGDGAMATDWMKQDEKWYHMDANGVMQIGWQELEDGWYYFDAFGVMVADSWVGESYFDPSGHWVPDAVKPPKEEPVVQPETEPSTEPPTQPEIEEAQPENPDARFQQRLQELQMKYPDGAYWNHVGYGVNADDYNTYSEVVTNAPCTDHYLYYDNIGLFCNSYYNGLMGNFIGYQCDGFVRKLSDEIYGVDTPVRFYEYSFDALSVGDYLRYESPDKSKQHSVFIIGKTANSILIAEANYGGTCMIKWGREIKRETIDGYFNNGYELTCFSRH